ncbi:MULTISPECIES: phenylacetate--CoA ligase family protein [Bacillaceae]|nr:MULTISPECIES: phenylacetate--CoA ligase family protein [Bacillaceae]MBF8118944.1 phenylacetate--CoA ligase family protein [Bacillus cereus]MED2683933.1 phenylacetate--CoA ligase family protein [Bacillus thuringiensis]HWO77243.1 phenylacetate--CoA ligase family protein [Bacillus sp. (in: firmicutes)]
MENISPLKAVMDIWKVKRGKPEDILSRQQSRLADLIIFARSNSQYYAQKYCQLPEQITSLQQIPPVTKSELMANFNDWVTDPEVTIESVKEFVSDMSLVGQLYLGRYMVSTTSGSTGVPGIFIQDKGSDTVMKTLMAIRGTTKLKWSDILKVAAKGGRNAAVCSTAGHFTAFSTAERLRLKHLNGKIRAFSIQSPLSTLVKELNEYQPPLIGGYATAMEILAEEQKAGRLNIQPVAILLGGEKLYPNVREKLGSVFQARVLDLYGGTEATAMTFECEEGQFHVNTDWIIFEPVDEYYQLVPPGKQSHSVLITNLANRIQPLIRYELTDRVIMSPEPCKCGRPFPVVQVEGRTDDILKFSASNGQIVHTLPLALKTIVEEIQGVRRFQLIQTAPDQLTVRLEVDEGPRDQVWENVREALLDYFATQGLTNLSIEKSDELPQRHPKSGKYQHVRIDYREQH